ncbi:MAG: ABC transporter permease [Anaerolineales bacterium]
MELIAFASIVITMKEANALVFLVRRHCDDFCGITYPMSMLPGWMQSLSQWLPQTYIIHAVRSAALSTEGFAGISHDLTMILIFGAVWLTIGYMMFVVMERRARQNRALSDSISQKETIMKQLYGYFQAW